MKKGLSQAVKSNNIYKVDRMLVQAKVKHNLDVNWQDRAGMTALQHACKLGYHKIAQLLLTNPAVDINHSDKEGYTAFFLACRRNHEDCAQLLLQHQPQLHQGQLHQGQLQPNIITFHHLAHPLQSIMYYDQLDTLKLWIAVTEPYSCNSPRWLFVTDDPVYKNVKEIVIYHLNVPIKYYGEKDYQLTRQLLTRYLDQPESVRLEVIRELGRERQLIAELFAVVVFVSDGLLTFKADSRDNNKVDNNSDSKITTAATVSFFRITSQLPIELQMLLCHLVFDSDLNNIKCCESELGFRWLANKYLSDDSDKHNDSCNVMW